jgi:hypothetical protein
VPLTRRTHLGRGSGFKRPVYERRPVVVSAVALRPGVRMVVVRGAAPAQPKEDPARSEAYRRLVAAMPCAHCGRAGPSQAAHADAGKGLVLKADDRTCFPLCADAPGRIGCHTLIGATGAFAREQRRTLEARYGAQTRASIRAAGLWPPGLPMWED